MESLARYAAQTKKHLDGILEKLGLTKDSVLKRSNLVTCPVDKGHLVPNAAIEEHTRKCEMSAAGYSREDIMDSTLNTKWFYQNTDQVVTVEIDKQAKAKILDKVYGSSDTMTEQEHAIKRSDVMVSEWTPQERLGLYEYVVDMAKAQNKALTVPEDELTLPDVKSNDEDDKPKTVWEVRAEMRDFKRRTKSYRAKNVHVTNKSYTEVIRDVITSQMGTIEKKQNDECHHKTSSDNHNPKIIEKNTDEAESRAGSSRNSSITDTRSSRKRSRSHSRSRKKSKHRHKHKKHRQ